MKKRDKITSLKINLTFIILSINTSSDITINKIIDNSLIKSVNDSLKNITIINYKK